MWNKPKLLSVIWGCCGDYGGGRHMEVICNMECSRLPMILIDIWKCYPPTCNKLKNSLVLNKFNFNILLHLAKFKCSMPQFTYTSWLWHSGILNSIADGRSVEIWRWWACNVRSISSIAEKHHLFTSLQLGLRKW